MAEETEMPEEIPIDDLIASTKMSLEAPAEHIAKPGRDGPGRVMQEIDSKDFNAGGHFTGHGKRNNQGVAITRGGQKIVGAQTEWFVETKADNGQPASPASTALSSEAPTSSRKPADAVTKPQVVDATPTGIRKVATTLLMDYLLSQETQGQMQLVQAVLLTDKQAQGKVLMIPVGDSVLYRINPLDWMATKQLLYQLMACMLPEEAGLLFRDQVEQHPDFAPFMALQSL